MFIQQQIDHLIQVNAGGDGWDAGRWEIQLKHYQKCNAIITCKFKQYYAKTFLATYRIQGTIWGRFLNDQQQKFILFSNGFSWRSLKSFRPCFYGRSCQKFDRQNPSPRFLSCPGLCLRPKIQKFSWPSLKKIRPTLVVRVWRF